MGDAGIGVEFPTTDDEGGRSTSALGRAVVADALRAVDPAGALAAERETNWRSGYLQHVRRLTEAGLAAPSAASTIASDGLGSLHARMRFVHASGDEDDLGAVTGMEPHASVATAQVVGTAEPERELSLPLHGRRLAGDVLRRQLADWVERDVIEPSCADAVETVMDHPEWLALPGRTVAVLGAGAEMGPLTALLRWGARVAGVDLPLPDVWRRVVATAHDHAGTLLVPVPEEHAGTDDPARVAGLDIVAQPADVAAWLEQLDGPLVLGNYVYADGRDNVRVATAVDAVTVRLLQVRPDDVALAFLATPTDVFAVPEEAVAASVAAYEGRSTAARLVGRPLRALSGGASCGAPTCRARRQGSATRSWRSRAPTTPWPSACSGGAPPRPARPARPSR